MYKNSSIRTRNLHLREFAVVLSVAEVEAAAKSGSDDDDDGHSLALALWGRSAIFYERRQMLRCLEDVKLSLRQRLPQELRLVPIDTIVPIYV